MVTKYVDKYFINPAIENGIQSYILYTEGKTYPPLFTFERNVIKVYDLLRI